MNRIKDLRVAAGLSQADLGRALGCVGQTVSKLEKESRQLDPAMINAICDLFGCSSDYLLGRTQSLQPVLTDQQVRLLAAYDGADPRDREFIDHLLRLDAPEEKKKLIAGIVVGVEGEYYAAKWLGISAGVNYAMQGWRFDYTDQSVITRLNYMNFPITGNIYILKGLALKTGVQFGVLLNAKNRVDRDDENIKDDCNKFCFSFPLGLSYESGNFVFDARYNFAVSNAIDRVNERKRSQMIQMTVGYKFAL